MGGVFGTDWKAEAEGIRRKEQSQDTKELAVACEGNVQN
jgi:hypothetical protein